VSPADCGEYKRVVLKCKKNRDHLVMISRIIHGGEPSTSLAGSSLNFKLKLCPETAVSLQIGDFENGYLCVLRIENRNSYCNTV